MNRRSFRRIHGRRWQVESAFSRCKRRLGSALIATSRMGQKREAYLRMPVFNLMLIRRAA